MPIKSWSLLTFLLHATSHAPRRRAVPWHGPRNPLAGFLPPLRTRNASRRSRAASRARTALSTAR